MLVAFANQGAAFGVPARLLEWPSLPGTLGSFLAIFGFVLLLLLCVTGNLAAPFRRSLWVAAALLALGLAVEAIPGWMRLDPDVLASRLMVAAALAAALWPDRRARVAGLAGAALLATLALAIHLEPHTWATGPGGQMVPVDAGAAWLHPVVAALLPWTGLASGAALLLGVPAARRPL